MKKNHAYYYDSKKNAAYWKIPNKNGEGYRLKRIKTYALLEEIQDTWRLADTWDKKMYFSLLWFLLLILIMIELTICLYLIYGFCFL